MELEAGMALGGENGPLDGLVPENITPRFPRP